MRSIALLVVVASLVSEPAGAGAAHASNEGDFRIEEATIADVHRAIEKGQVTARQLVLQSLQRIEAFDKAGPALNAIITINPRALERADELDALFAEEGLVGALHGIPVIVKDNYDTGDMPTSAGSLSLKQSLPPDDAYQVRRLREEGAIIIAKANMYEFAFSPYETVGSALPGYTRNPYALNRVTAGSSGGTAAAVAASFAMVGLGTDTGNSIRGPSSHTALVGIRSTMGLTSRDGIVPLYLDHDVGGPMARTVEDAALVLSVIAGHDPADSVTEAALGVDHGDYRRYLERGGLRGARIGILRQLSNRDGADAEVLARFEQALEAMRNAGAAVVDALLIPELAKLVPPVQGDALTVWCPSFRTDLEGYLASLGAAAPVTTLQQIIDSGQFHPDVGADLEYFQRQPPPDQNHDCRASVGNRELLRRSVRALLNEHRLDALAFPTWSNPPRLIGDLNTPHGDNSQHIAPHAGFPAITVPMGYVHDGLPVGLQLTGDAFSEPVLIRLAYAFEQSTQHRRPPPITPALD
ncbi:MAG: amidase family protein [Woeseia sp.]